MFKKKNADLKKIILASGLFDESFYLERYEDAKSSRKTAIDHYLQIGLDEDRKPNALFDSEWYREYYEDVKQDSGYPFIHYIVFGQKENRFINEQEKNDYEALSFTQLFDAEFYKDVNDDLKVEDDAFNYLLHFVRVGMYEGREANAHFDSEWYKRNYEKLMKDLKTPIMDYLHYGEKESRFINEQEKNDYEALSLSQLFDKEFYKLNNEDLKTQTEGFDYLLHFIRLGMYEGREPNADFDSAWYKKNYEESSNEFKSPIMDYLYRGLKENRFLNEQEKNDYEALKESAFFDEIFYKNSSKDLKEKPEGFDFLLHFLRIGIQEGLEPNSTFDSKWYKEYNKDLKDESRLPFIHYLHYGREEGRFANALEVTTYNILYDSHLFDAEFYKNDLSHFVRVGMYEGKEPNATFDSQWYGEYYEDIDTSLISSIAHYIYHGEKENRFVNKFEKESYEVLLESNLFDEEFYKRNYQDLINEEEGFDFALDFVRCGLKEKREPNAKFDSYWYKKYYLDSRKQSMLLPIIHYIKFGKKENYFVNELEEREYKHLLDSKLFDIEFYRNSYKDLEDKKDDFDFLLHYIRFGKAQMRQMSEESEGLSEKELVEYKIIHDANLDWRLYKVDYKHKPMDDDYVYDYVKNWKEYHPILSGFFDTDFYLDRYPDIVEVKMNPLVHYLVGGQEEGREAVFDDSKIVSGEVEYVKQKETVVFVSHESSASGAPLLGLNITNQLVDKYNVVHIIIKELNIHKAFLKNCDLMYSSIEENQYGDSYIFLKRLLKEREIKSVICNSIVTSEVLRAAYDLGISTLLLIHEFTEYTKPANRTMYAALSADNVVVPATIIQDSLMQEVVKNNWVNSVPNNIHILPQGKLPFIPKGHGENDTVTELYKKLKITSPENTKIVIGTGWVQIRKGVDLFVETARQIKKNYDGLCKFIWVGGGFDVENDLAYSVWLNRELQYSGLDDDILFLEHQENLDTVFSIADIFCLTSRMDPFPNVVIDALSHDVHVACFDNATGSSEFLLKHDAECTIVDYVDTYELAQGIIKNFKSEKKQNGVNKAIVEEHLNFETYVDALDSLLDKGREFKTRSQGIQEYLLQSGEFDAEYFGENLENEKACRKYVETSLKGVHFKNPKAGFSQLEWISKHAYKSDRVPLYEALKEDESFTHDAQVVPYETKEKIEFFYAVHIHLFYIELAYEFAEYFKTLPGKFDILVTIVDEEDEEEALKCFSKCNAHDIKISLVKNIGRDSGPLYFGCKEEISKNKYEVIGHFHSKKSHDIDDGLGDRWRKFLLETLVGDSDVSLSVLSLFNQEKVGLIFADDNHVVDMGENKKYLESLCKMINIPHIEETAVFPVGNMFWARVDAIKQLFTLDASKVLEEEPLPYDGSCMHALERMTPFLVQYNSYDFKTVCKKGVVW